ncbi:MAG: hypothetical protein JSV35_03845 [Candidatus Bathyarchaeota archaeon]|nr:MAG: hypothetical protein JSV35_03845 [Candidatus Bathyarchaeota archaeon]
MNEKISMPFVALLAFCVLTPLVAAPAVRVSYTADVSLVITDPGESWTKGGILQVRGLIAVGTFDSADLGIFGATMWKKLDYTLNTMTGSGTMHGIFILTVDGVGSFEGSFRDRISDSTHLAGTVVGQGTGDFEGVKTMGIWYGDIVDGTVENVLEAQLLFPRE